MSLATMAEGINETTGWTGDQLEAATHVMAMLFADAIGQAAIGDYFKRRANDCLARADRKEAYAAFKEERRLEHRQELTAKYGPIP